MKVKELKAVLNGANDEAEIIIMTTYSGSQYNTDNASISDGDSTGGSGQGGYKIARRGDVFIEAYFSDE